MTIRTLFMSGNGHTYADIVKPYYSLIELPDGYHPCIKSALLKDDTKKQKAIMVCWDGIATPEGCEMSKEFVENVLAENEEHKIHKQKVSVDKMFWRGLWRGFINLFRVIYLVVFLFFVYLMLYMVVLL